MLDKTIENALQQLHSQALNGKGGMEHILALMALRGFEPDKKRRSPIGGDRRKDTKALVLRALRDGVTDSGGMARLLMQLRPDLTAKQAH